MHLLVTGINHTTAPIEVREWFAVSAEQLTATLDALKATKSVLECVIVNTCNRMELYAVVDKLDRGRDYMMRFIRDRFHVSEENLRQYSYCYEELEACRHLFRVTCGLDSLIIGETQILGQVKDHFAIAQAHRTTGAVLNTLFKEAITVAKRAHTETEISEHPVSVGYAAVELAKQMFGEFENRHILMIGAGKMAELTVKHLLGQGANRFSIVNRTLENAQLLAATCAGQAYTFTDLKRLLVEADMVISSTGSSEWILHRADVDAAMSMRPNRLLFMIDIALPRDLDPQIHETPNVFLYDIDDLRGIVDYNLEQRKAAIIKIEAMIGESLSGFRSWLNMLGVTPLIKALQDKANDIHSETMASLHNKLPELTERERRIIHKLTKSMLNQMMRDPILKLKEQSVQAGHRQTKEMFSQLFNLDPDMKQSASPQTGERANDLPHQDAGANPEEALHRQLKATMERVFAAATAPTRER